MFKLKKRNIVSALCLICLSVLVLVGCSSNDNGKDTDIASSKNMKLIYEETISPNKEYVKSEEEIVNYTVEVYQDKNNKILVNAKSNSAFFDPLKYELGYDKEITKTDIDIEWTTIMGNTSATEDDQLSVADVSISKNGEVFNERKINFVDKGIEIIVDILNKK